MSTLYELIGRLVVGFVRLRYRRQLRIAGGVGIALAMFIAYVLASRDVEEG